MVSFLTPPLTRACARIGHAAPSGHVVLAVLRDAVRPTHSPASATAFSAARGLQPWVRRLRVQGQCGG